MSKIIEWFARNGVAANLLAALIVASGLLSFMLLRYEVLPEFSSGLITVSVVYPGAAPVETEEGICVRIEEEIQGIDGIKKITSTAAEGAGSVTIELLPRADARRVLDDVKARVDAIETFPEEAEKPVIQEVLLRKQVINVAVSGDADERTLKRLGERVRDEISLLPGITQVELANVRPYEISIEISENTLRRHGITFEEVAAAVRRKSLDIPGGSIKTPGGEVLLRTKGQAYRGEEFAAIPLRTLPDGTRLLIGDVARVVDGFEETDQSSRFDGKPSALVQVFRVGDQSALAISRKVGEYVREAAAGMPEGVTLTTWQDDSSYLRSRLDLLMRNGRTGFILVFLVLALFLRFRLAFWVSLGIPISFLGTLWLMPHLDVSINLISLFAFIVVLGIVVDDAIIVGENIHTHQSRGDGGLGGAMAGAKEVAVPVIFAVMTTVAAFFPLLHVEGNTGKIMRVIPLIVIPTLLFSLVESLLILPAHLRHLHAKKEGGPKGAIPRIWDRFQTRFTRFLDRFIREAYQPFLEQALRWRYLTVAAALAILLFTLGLVGGGWIRFYFFPPVEGDNVAAMVTMPLGTPVEVTQAAVERLEQTAMQVRDEVDAKKLGGDGGIYRHLMASVGGQPFRTELSRGGGNIRAAFKGAHLGEVHIEVTASEERDITSTEVAQRWRELTGPIPGAVELSFTASLFSPGEAINVQLTGHDMDDLKQAAEKLKVRLGEYPGVLDITDSFRAGKEELTLRVKPEAEASGIGLGELGRQVRQAFYGEEAQRIQRGRDELKVMVRYPAEERRALEDIESLRLRTADGTELPFLTVAEAGRGRGYAAISRADRRRAINVTADVDPATGEPDKIVADLERNFLGQLQAEHPGLNYTFEGARREQAETMGGLARGFLLALVLIYGLLAVPFKSYIQPMIVMTAIPFGLVGAVWGHVIMGMDMTLLSGFGIVALTGVVVNDSLVMVDFVNRNRARGMTLHDAVRQAGVMRFRPILLTSLTTFAGLTPLLLERSVQAKFLMPMAISLGFGVMFATLITLLLVPAGYIILEDVRRAVGLKPHGEEGM